MYGDRKHYDGCIGVKKENGMHYNYCFFKRILSKEKNTRLIDTKSLTNYIFRDLLYIDQNNIYLDKLFRNVKYEFLLLI